MEIYSRNDKCCITYKLGTVIEWVICTIISSVKWHHWNHFCELGISIPFLIIWIYLLDGRTKCELISLETFFSNHHITPVHLETISLLSKVSYFTLGKTILFCDIHYFMVWQSTFFTKLSMSLTVNFNSSPLMAP